MLEISKILDSKSNIYNMVRQDLATTSQNIGANGMTAEQIVRSAIVQKIEPTADYPNVLYNVNRGSTQFSWHCKESIEHARYLIPKVKLFIQICLQYRMGSQFVNLAEEIDNTL